MPNPLIERYYSPLGSTPKDMRNIRRKWEALRQEAASGLQVRIAEARKAKRTDEVAELEELLGELDV